MNGTGADWSDSEGDSSIYKLKYERAKKELKVFERRMQQQHDDDMEQMMVLKKQLDKKVGVKSSLFFELCRTIQPRNLNSYTKTQISQLLDKNSKIRPTSFTTLI